MESQRGDGADSRFARKRICGCVGGGGSFEFALGAIGAFVFHIEGCEIAASVRLLPRSTAGH